ncbi:MAG: xylulokinase [Chitinophagaceae bacterium]
MQYLLGIDIGSSSVKVALMEGITGKCLGSAFSPSREMDISSPQEGWAEQDPSIWWNELILAMDLLRKKVSFKGDQVLALGISYQMHGLVCLDKHHEVLRPSIIWCDSRAVEMGREAMEGLGKEYCLHHYLNSPGNFTASKLAWVKKMEPLVFEKIDHFCLPGDYIAMKLTGDLSTTISGLSEGILWDFQERQPAKNLLNYFGIRSALLAPLVLTFGDQGKLCTEAATILGLHAGIPLTYRAGDQPNNAYSLCVVQPGEVAANAGTSGVIYGVSENVEFDPLSRVNTFVHVNDRPEAPRNGVLLCVNGTGILNSWLRKNMGEFSYDQINAMAAQVSPGSDGLKIFPFGNGVERILGNKCPGARISSLDFNRHSRSHVFRAAQEGIVFSLRYGLDIMRQMKVSTTTIRAGKTNMFLSPVFTQTFSNVTQTRIELLDTDGAQGAARAAGVGCGFYASPEESFLGMQRVGTIEPQSGLDHRYQEVYQSWKEELENLLKC